MNQQTQSAHRPSSPESGDPSRSGCERSHFVHSLSNGKTANSNDPIGSNAKRTAEELHRGFLAHDERDRGRACESFSAVDERQFTHLDADDARRAADAYVEALWEKDRAELSSRLTGSDGLDRARWGRVEKSLKRRAKILGMDEQYATKTTEAWKRHALGGEYRTPMMTAKLHEIHAMIGMDGPEASLYESDLSHIVSRYLVGVEIHSRYDDSGGTQVAAIMTPYFEAIGRRRERR